MKKLIPYLLLLIILAGIIMLIVNSSSSSSGKGVVLDERITLRKEQKIPYGTNFAWKHIASMFPDAKLVSENSEPGYWDSIDTYGHHQAIIIISRVFFPDNYEMEKIIDFAKRGNDVFISAADFSYDAQNELKCYVSQRNPVFSNADSLWLELQEPPFTGKLDYQYPGKKFDAYINQYDRDITEILAWDAGNKPVLARFRTGEGNIYINTLPITLTNYFLLHEHNSNYMEKMFSLISPETEKILWDEYFLYKKYEDNQDDGEKGWLRVLLGQPGFRAAFFTALGTLLLFVLLETRRKQRFIPVVEKPKNESLDFVKTIGRLYYDKSNHRNLCNKMAAYFLEHVRNKYRLPTNYLDEAFVKNLHYKSGYPETGVQDIISFIHTINISPEINDNQLKEFYNQLESFYNKT